ncbi:hypothetical protein [Kitasatospora sp. NPDC093558]|uniref:hypothetical protein n=1 Tax=Kitasatospora sp. NPDC093558 TaxID=3155201 RepID=UPI0034405527
MDRGQDGRLKQYENGTLVPLGALYAAALAEHRLVVHLVTTTGYDGPTAHRPPAPATRLPHGPGLHRSYPREADSASTRSQTSSWE